MTSLDLQLSGRTAAVAASSSGLGLGAARALAAAGVRVAMCGRDPGRLAEAATSVPGAVTIVADVSTIAGAAGFVTDAIAALGSVDILVTNAGGPPPGTFASTPVEAYPAALELNLLSIVAMCKVAVPPMQSRRWGRVVAITSVSVRQPIAHLILSNTARSGATAFLKTLALEVAADGVTVNTLQPGLHLTGRIRDLYGDDTDAVAAGVPSRTLGDPDDFGQIAAFLCSPYCRFVTGASIPVDGGAFSGLQ